MPSIENTNKYKYSDYYYELKNVEDEAFLLGNSLTEIEYPTLIYNTHQISTNVDISIINKSTSKSTFDKKLKEQLKEEEAFVLFNSIIS